MIYADNSLPENLKGHGVGVIIFKIHKITIYQL